MKMVQLNDLLPPDQWESNWTFYGEEHEGLPDGAEYVVFEYYCESAKCDCQGLIADIIQIGEDGEPMDKPMAIVNYDWSSNKTLCYPTLDDKSPKTPLALHILEVYKKFIHNEEYLMRIKNQYSHVKILASEKLIKNLTRKISKNIGRNDPCHCGSNIKYKKCCLNG